MHSLTASAEKKPFQSEFEKVVLQVNTTRSLGCHPMAKSNLVTVSFPKPGSTMLHRVQHKKYLSFEESLKG
jgi:hypothetical protein